MQAEIVAGCSDGRIYAWEKDGTDVKGWPRNLTYEFGSAASICDLDGDGHVDLVIGGYDALVHVFEINAPYNKSTMEWPKLHHDIYNSNLYRGPSRSDVPPVGPTVPAALTLMCYPSPAISSVHVWLGVPSIDAGKVSVEVYDVRGRLVRQVADRVFEPGFHDVQWNGADANGQHVASGIYFVKVSQMGDNLSRKIVLVR
jgi:hypothetical protein